MQPLAEQSQNKFNVQVFCVTVVTVLIASIYFNYQSKKAALDYQFSGKVDSVDYNLKSQASVFIKGVQYDLFYSRWDFNHNRIQKGDSIVKKKNSTIIKLIRPNGRVVTQGGDN